MAEARAAQYDARQLWLEMARPIEPRPLHARPVRGLRARAAVPPAVPQMELSMAAAPLDPRAAERAPTLPPIGDPIEQPPAPPVRETPKKDAPGCFVTWLRDQHGKGGAIGELAKAARLDPSFPRQGTADDVRARFGRAGADGDAHEALDDAERDYDRLGGG